MWPCAEERKWRTDDLIVLEHIWEICMSILKNLNNVLKPQHHFVLYEIPSRDTFASVHKDDHCSTVYKNRSHINLKIHGVGVGFINYSTFPL